MTVKLDEILSLFHDDFVLPQIPQLYNFAVCRQPQPAKLGHRPNPAALVGFALYHSKTKQQSVKNGVPPTKKFWRPNYQVLGRS